MRKITKQQKLCMDRYRSSGIEKSAYHWHIWKRAFNLGWWLSVDERRSTANSVPKDN